MCRFIISIIAGIAVSAPAKAQEIPVIHVDPYHVRIAAECLRSDETDPSRHDCYVNQYGELSWTPKMRQLAKVEPCP